MNKNFNLNIHYLRGLASLLVLFAHFKVSIFHYLDGSFGVDVFFIISGYVMASSVRNFSHKSKFRAVISFMIRRLIRIIPPFALVLFPVLFYTGRIVQDNILVDIFFLNNYNNSEFPIFSTWSLTYELNFYIIMSIFLFFENKFILKFFLFLTGIVGVLINFESILLKLFA